MSAGVLHKAGECRFCRCTEDDPLHPPCTVPGGDTCSWHDRARTVCTAPGCLTAYFLQQDRLKAENSRALRKRTPGQVHAQQKEERNAKQRAYRAKRKQQRGAA